LASEVADFLVPAFYLKWLSPKAQEKTLDRSFDDDFEARFIVINGTGRDIFVLAEPEYTEQYTEWEVRADGSEGVKYINGTGPPFLGDGPFGVYSRLQSVQHATEFREARPRQSIYVRSRIPLLLLSDGTTGQTALVTLRYHFRYNTSCNGDDQEILIERNWVVISTGRLNKPTTNSGSDKGS
jgi:hypothetical protein